jgi:hypothetical protein
MFLTGLFAIQGLSNKALQSWEIDNQGLTVFEFRMETIADSRHYHQRQHIIQTLLTGEIPNTTMFPM